MAERFPGDKDIFTPQERKAVGQCGVGNHIAKEDRTGGSSSMLLLFSHVAKSNVTFGCYSNERRN